MAVLGRGGPTGEVHPLLIAEVCSRAQVSLAMRRAGVNRELLARTAYRLPQVSFDRKTDYRNYKDSRKEAFFAYPSYPSSVFELRLEATVQIGAGPDPRKPVEERLLFQDL